MKTTDLNMNLYKHQLDAIANVMSDGVPLGHVGMLGPFCVPHAWSGKTNLLQSRIRAMSPADREEFLANVVIVGPTIDNADFIGYLRELTEAPCTPIHARADMHLAAISGGGRSTPVRIDNFTVIADETPQRRHQRREAPGATDMFRMFCDKQQEKRGKW